MSAATDVGISPLATLQVQHSHPGTRPEAAGVGPVALATLGAPAGQDVAIELVGLGANQPVNPVAEKRFAGMSDVAPQLVAPKSIPQPTLRKKIGVFLLASAGQGVMSGTLNNQITSKWNYGLVDAAGRGAGTAVVVQLCKGLSQQETTTLGKLAWPTLGLISAVAWDGIFYLQNHLSAHPDSNTPVFGETSALAAGATVGVYSRELTKLAEKMKEKGRYILWGMVPVISAASGYVKRRVQANLVTALLNSNASQVLSRVGKSIAVAHQGNARRMGALAGLTAVAVAVDIGEGRLVAPVDPTQNKIVTDISGVAALTSAIVAFKIKEKSNAVLGNIQKLLKEFKQVKDQITQRNKESDKPLLDAVQNAIDTLEFYSKDLEKLSHEFKAALKDQRSNREIDQMHEYLLETAMPKYKAGLKTVFTTLADHLGSLELKESDDPLHMKVLNIHKTLEKLSKDYGKKAKEAGAGQMALLVVAAAIPNVMASGVARGSTAIMGSETPTMLGGSVTMATGVNKMFWNSILKKTRSVAKQVFLTGLCFGTAAVAAVAVSGGDVSQHAPALFVGATAATATQLAVNRLRKASWFLPKWYKAEREIAAVELCQKMQAVPGSQQQAAIC
jgi:hypothetical protein